MQKVRFTVTERLALVEALQVYESALRLGVAIAESVEDDGPAIPDSTRETLRAVTTALEKIQNAPRAGMMNVIPIQRSPFNVFAPDVCDCPVCRGYRDKFES